MSAPPAFDSHRRPKWPSVTVNVVVIHPPVLVPEIERAGAVQPDDERVRDGTQHVALDARAAQRHGAAAARRRERAGVGAAVGAGGAAAAVGLAHLGNVWERGHGVGCHWAESSGGAGLV